MKELCQRWKTLAAAAALAIVPAVLSAQAPARETGLILSSMEAAVNTEVERVPDFRLVVDLSDRTLYMMSGDREVRHWPVSVGQEGYDTPPGSYRIRHMIWNPRWVPPPSPWARGKTAEEPGSPGNPMGRVKMFFREPDLYIHGTALPSSLGNARSHGCIRMRNIDAVEVARIVMIHAGVNRPQAWYDETVAKADTSREVQLTRPVALTVRP